MQVHLHYFWFFNQISRDCATFFVVRAETTVKTEPFPSPPQPRRHACRHRSPASRNTEGVPADLFSEAQGMLKAVRDAKKSLLSTSVQDAAALGCCRAAA